MIGTQLVAAALLAATAVNAARKPSDNWSGGSHYGSDFVEASADIVVPECTVGIPAYDYVPYFASGWVGIDGNANCNNVVFQTGFDCYVIRENGVTNVTYGIWTEWFPTPAVYYNETLDLRAGDVLSARVVAHSKTSGVSYLENRRNGKKVQTSYDNQTALCQNGVEWVIESEFAFSEGGFLTGERTAGYNPLKFERAEYHTKDGKKHLAQADDMFNMVQNGTTVATAVFNRPGCFQVNDTTPANFAAGDF